MKPSDASAPSPRSMDASSARARARRLHAVPDLPDEGGEAHEAHGGGGCSVAAEEAEFGGRDAGELERMRAQLQDRLNAYVVSGRARVVLTDNVHTMVTIKRGHGVLTFRMHHMFVDAPSAIVRALAHYGERKEREASDLLRRYIDANEAKIRTRTRVRPVAVDVEGKYHNLQSIFDELNAQYFDGRIRARITWGPRTKRKRRRDSIRLGSYTLEDELIRIHPVLDASDVPRWFVAWIVYHEMLHEVHDMPVIDGRRIYHTRAFREAEARFEHYAACVMWERANLERLLTR